VIWLTWRQHRYENIVVAGILALLAFLLIPTGLHIASVFDHTGVRACVTRHAPATFDCGNAISAFGNRFSQLQSLGAWFNLIPGLFGVLLAAPLILELEQGTYRLAWTQSVTRRRWLATKLALILAGAVALGAAFTVLFTWWHHPSDLLWGRIAPNFFGLEGITPFAYTLFAAALALVLGALTRRTAVAVGSAFGIYIAVRLAVQGYARQHFLTPARTIWSMTAQQPAQIAHSWLLNSSFADRLGHPIANPMTVLGPCINKGFDAVTKNNQCLAEHGVFNLSVYIPESRFWALQIIEAGLFAGLAVLLAAVATAAITRRLA
jgi:hypothetical protein